MVKKHLEAHGDRMLTTVSFLPPVIPWLIRFSCLAATSTFLLSVPASLRGMRREGIMING